MAATSPSAPDRLAGAASAPAAGRRPGGAVAPLVRVALAVAFFGGLAWLEVDGALDRLRAQREQRRAELVDLADRQQERLGKEVVDLLGEGRRHAAFLARSPAVRDRLRALGAGPPPEDALPGGGERELERWLLPYLVGFSGLDRIRLLDSQGRERFRVERMGAGVAAIPAPLLDAAPNETLQALAREARAGEVVVSRLLVDAGRVEVAESDRRVFHWVAPVDDGAARGVERLGAVAVTVYAAPLLDALAGFEPLPGTASCLLDERGAVFAPEPDASPAARALARRLAAPALQAALGAGPARCELADAVVLVRPTGRSPAAHLLSAVPREALASGGAELRGTTLRTLLRTALVLVAIAAGSAVFVRASLRARRLRETEGYLARIRQESAKQRALMEAAADMLLIVDPADAALRDSNPAAREVLGLAGDDGLALDALGERFDPADLARLRGGIEDAAREPGRAVTVTGLALVGADGARREVDARCVGIVAGPERLVELSLSDRTREREMERRVRTGERLGALGLLTAGVAHEINNPLEGIANYVSLLERPDLPADRRARYLEQVRVGFQRIRDLTGDLLRFARSDREEGTADLARAVRRAAELARWSSDARQARLELRGLDEPLPVPGGEARLEQVLLNLLLNAGRAAGPGGSILVTAVRDDPERVELTVADDGPGIPAEDLPHVFDPFFTRSGGTGLGLSVSYGIVRAHGGELVAANRPEGGAAFTLRLPRGPREDADGTA